MLLLLLYEKGTFALKNGADEGVRGWTSGRSLPV